MSLFIEHLGKYDFLQYAIIGCALASIACGSMGSFIVVRRTTYLAGAIAHCVLGGMGAARYFQHVHGITWLSPLLGAIIAAVLAAIIISLITLSGRQREDTVISAIWAIGMAIGISFISITPGYYEDLMSYLFGNILMIGTSDIIHMALMDGVIIILLLCFYDRFLIISFQPELAKLRGIHVGIYQTLLLIMTALTVVLLTQVVGLIMVIALLTLPAATSFKFSGRLWVVMLIATFICLCETIGGIAISYGPELPAGATVIELAASVYIIVIGGSWLFSKLKKQKHLSTP